MNVVNRRHPERIRMMSFRRPTISKDNIFYHHDLRSLAFTFASKGLSVGVVQPMIMEFQFDQYCPKQSNEAVLLFTAQKQDFERMNRVAKENQLKTNALIIWGGKHDDMPQSDDFPVLSVQQINDKKGMLNWHDLCEMATMPPQNTEQPNVQAKKPLWKRLFG